MLKLTHIFFDADGVVITPPQKISDRLIKDLKTPHSCLQSFFTTDFVDCVLSKTNMKKIITPFLKKWDWVKSTDDFLTYWFTSFSCDIGCKKPQIEYLFKIHHFVDTPPKDKTLFVDDSQPNLATAKKFGFYTHLYTDIVSFALQWHSQYHLLTHS